MNIQEVRQRYPQYNDLSDEQLAKALHGKFYADMPYEQFASKVGLSAPTAQQEPPRDEPSLLSSIARQVGLTARAPVNAALAIPAAIGDVVTGGRSTPAVKTVLDFVFPTPETPTERIAQDAAGAMAGGAGLAKATKTGTTMLQQTLAAGGGGAGAGGSREAGFGPAGQFVASLAGGVVAPSAYAAAAEGGKAALRGARGMVEPFTESGRRTIAARAMQSNSDDPRAAATNIREAPEYVPGQQPTTAELAGDSRLSALQKTVRNQNPAEFADRAATQDAIRQEYLRRAFGTQADVDAAIASREAATKPLRDGALDAANKTGADTVALQAGLSQKTQSKAGALQNMGQMQAEAAQAQVRADNFMPVPGMPRVPGRLSANSERVPEYRAGAADAARIAAQREAERRVLQASLDAMPHAPLKSGPLVHSISGVVNAPGKRASDVVMKTLSRVREKILEHSDENGIIDARDLYTIRKELGNTIETFAKESSNWDKRLAAGLERDLQRQIDAAIVKAGGVRWPQYLRQYSDLSKKIESMRLGQDIAAASRNPMTERLSPAQFTRQFESRAEDIAGAGAQTSDILSRVAADLRRSAAPDAAMRAPGSDTLQNLIGANMLQRAGVAPGPFGRVASGLLGKLYGPMEQQTQGLLTRGLLDPEFGAELLGAQISKDPKLAEELLRRLLVTPGAGLLGASIAQ